MKKSKATPRKIKAVTPHPVPKHTLANHGISIIHAGPQFPEEFRDTYCRTPIEPYEPLPIKTLSTATQVYIWSASPYVQVIDMGSFGSKRFEGMGVDAFFNGVVAGPVIIPGLINECVTGCDSESMAIRRYHRPTGRFAGYEYNPGLGFAMEVTDELRQFGVFVTTTEDRDDIEWKRAFSRARVAVMNVAEKRCAMADKNYADGRPYSSAGFENLDSDHKLSGRLNAESKWM